jgi:hypothetical protein
VTGSSPYSRVIQGMDGGEQEFGFDLVWFGLRSCSSGWGRRRRRQEGLLSLISSVVALEQGLLFKKSEELRARKVGEDMGDTCESTKIRSFERHKTFPLPTRKRKV